MACPPATGYKLHAIDIFILSALYEATAPITFLAIQRYLNNTNYMPRRATVWIAINRLHKQHILEKHIAGRFFRYSITMQGTALLHTIDHALASIKK